MDFYGFLGLRDLLDAWHSPICEKLAEILINFEKGANEANTDYPSREAVEVP
jgi:hypothetical protein